MTEERTTDNISDFMMKNPNFTGILRHEDGNKFWLKNGQLHREDGPAIEWSDREKQWYKHNNLWWLNGVSIREEAYKKWQREKKLKTFLKNS